MFSFSKWRETQKRLSNRLLSRDDSWGIELSASPSSVQYGWVSAEEGPLPNVSLKSPVASDQGHAGKLMAIAAWLCPGHLRSLLCGPA